MQEIQGNPLSTYSRNLGVLGILPSLYPSGSTCIYFEIWYRGILVIFTVRNWNKEAHSTFPDSEEHTRRVADLE